MYKIIPYYHSGNLAQAGTVEINLITEDCIGGTVITSNYHKLGYWLFFDRETGQGYTTPQCHICLEDLD